MCLWLPVKPGTSRSRHPFCRRERLMLGLACVFLLSRRSCSQEIIIVMVERTYWPDVAVSESVLKELLKMEVLTFLHQLEASCFTSWNAESVVFPHYCFNSDCDAATLAIFGLLCFPLHQLKHCHGQTWRQLLQNWKPDLVWCVAFPLCAHVS